MDTLSYSEKQRICENNFNLSGPFWHLCTDGTQMQDIFCCEDDFKLGMHIIASASCLSAKVQIVAFEIMSNHLHLILAGRHEECLDLFTRVSQKLKRVYAKAGRAIDWSSFEAELIPIESLDALRNEILYTHRNAYVASQNFNPFSYPWGSGRDYFNRAYPQNFLQSFDSLSYKERREITHCRDISPFGKLKFINGVVHIPSFCNIKLGESMFTDSRSYFNSLTRRAEAFSLIAERLKDKVFLTDDEMYNVALQYSRDKFDISRLALLSPEQRIQTAKEIHYRYNASLQQIRRILRLEPAVLNAMFH